MPPELAGPTSTPVIRWKIQHPRVSFLQESPFRVAHEGYPARVCISVIIVVAPLFYAQRAREMRER